MVPYFVTNYGLNVSVIDIDLPFNVYMGMWPLVSYAVDTISRSGCMGVIYII